MADLIDQTTLGLFLAENKLSTNQTAILPQITAAASRKIRVYCNRYFNRQTTIDELYTTDPGKPLLLREYPVNAVWRCASYPTTVYTVQNSDTSTNQRALARILTTGDVDAGLVVTGLSLTRVASGVTTTNNLLFATYTTLTSLANAVAALGNGWTATADMAYALWPTSDLRAVQGNLPAWGKDAEFQVHTQDVPFSMDEKIGAVWIQDRTIDPFASIRFGPFLTTDFGDVSVSGAPMGVRVIYDAGFDTVPVDVQEACAELTYDFLNTLSMSTRINSETIGDYSYDSVGIDRLAIPQPILCKIAPYRNTRA